MLFSLRAADLDPVDLESALLRAAVGDFFSEAAVLLLANDGHWLPTLAATDLITIETDDDDAAPLTGDVPGTAWAAITWSELDDALTAGRIEGSRGQLCILRAAASIAEGHPVDLGDTAAGLDRRHLQLLLAAISHAGGSHQHRNTRPAGLASQVLPSLMPWPAWD